MLNKISLNFFVVIKLHTLNLLFLSFGLVFFFCQFSYAEEFFAINKENLSSTEKIVETQTYIDLVWGAYVYRKPAYAFPKDPAATPLPYVPAPSKKNVAKASSSASLPASSVKPNVAVSTPTASTSSVSGVTQSTNTVKAENPVEKATEVKPEVKSDPKAEMNTEKSEVKSEPKAEVKTENPEVLPVSTPIVSSTPSVSPVVQTAPDPQNPLNAPIAPDNGMINVIDGASRPPYESFVSDLGELKDM